MRFGIALSGGGFRAALFHLGVLACLADLRRLKSARYLSTVSGGSIVGAAYYLKVKQLLENRRADGLNPSDDAYVTIVRELIHLFLSGVQQNIRMRTFLNPRRNARMMRADYSRSDHIGELYARYFYKPIWKEMGLELEHEAIPLRHMKIFPGGKDPEDAERYNDEETHPFKIPVLIINATTLNSGHNWQFTASYVGEPVRRCLPGTHETVDRNRIFERRRFDQTYSDPRINRKLNELTLGDAVAASACVPVLFKPMAIHDLYTSDTVIQLVDGGVFDNQGLASLFDKRATEILCSDASLHIQDEEDPSTSPENVLFRSNDIVMDALREGELNTLIRRTPGYELAASFLLHWNQEFPESFHDPEVVPLSRDLLTLLSHVRTDLDSFHDTEAYALMYAGYVLCSARLGGQLPNGKPTRWIFWQIVPHIQTPKIRTMLGVSSYRLFKVFRLKDTLAWLALAGLGSAVLIVAIFLGFVLWRNWQQRLGEICQAGCQSALQPLSTMSHVLLTLIMIVSLLAAWRSRHLRRWLKQFPRLRRVRDLITAGLTSPVLSWIPAGILLAVTPVVWLSLKIFDRRYLVVGRLADRP